MVHIGVTTLELCLAQAVLPRDWTYCVYIWFTWYQWNKILGSCPGWLSPLQHARA